MNEVKPKSGKITLSSINNFSLDAIIQHVARHLILQNQRSYDEDCKYKSEGLSCAVGCLVSDEEYDPEMEGAAIRDKRFDKFGIGAQRRALLNSLQLVHDSMMPYEWHNELMSVCNQYGLDTAALEAVIGAATAERQAGEVK